MANKFHNPPTVALAGKYSLGGEVPAGSRVLYVSGQVGLDSKGKLGATIEKQCELAWKNIGQGRNHMRSVAAWLVASMAVVGVAHAADPLVPAPQGAPMLLEVAADGVQIYACEAKGQGFEWVFKAPEASLFNTQNLQIGTHFAGPTWKADDGSTIVGEVAARADAPAGGAIPWLLLKAKSHQGSGVLSTVAFIRRADTKGGVAPASGCDAARNGAQARVRYYALYQFFGAAK